MGPHIDTSGRLGREDGFTLLELAIALLVIGVLVGFTFSSFRGAAHAAQISAARQRVMAGLKAETVVKVATGMYLGTATQARRDLLAAEEPSLDWGATSKRNPNDVTVRVGRLAIGGTTYRQSWICLESAAVTGERVAVAQISVGPQRGTYYGEREGAGRLCRNPGDFTSWPTTSW
jgi:prepilin-type N-terminal cleavage/methylation domain-containing protein